MTTVAEIKEAIIQLPPEALRELREWYEQFDAQQWDEELEADVAAGRLDHLADEALRDLMDEIGAKAETRSLTPEILETLLRDDA